MPPRNKIATLPDDLRAWLHKAIVQRGYGDIVTLTEELNALCKEGGLAISIGKSAVGAESQRIKRASEAIRATTEACKLIADQARDDGDTRSEAVMAMIQDGMFEAILAAREAEAMEDPAERLGLMSQAALAASRISRTRVNQAKWRDELELRAKVAAEKVAKIAKRGGADARTVAEIRSQILGIVRRDPVPAQQPAGGAA